MRGTSQASRDAVLKEFDPVITAAGTDALTIGTEVFEVVDVLDASGSLRRALTDPARPGTDKGALVRRLFSALDSRAQDVVAALAEARWSGEGDLAQSAEDAGVQALLAYAETQGTLETVEEQLFRVERLLAGERELLTAMGNRAATRETRLELLHGVFGGKLDQTTQALVARAVGSPRDRRLVAALRDFIEAAAARRDRSVARVVAAVELSAAQRTRLAGILANAYGREIQLNVAVDPQVLGGIRVQVGSEVVDGSVLARLDEARRRLVG